MFSNVRRGYRICKRSLAVLRQRPLLLAFPLASSVIVLAVLLVFGGVVLEIASIANPGGESALDSLLQVATNLEDGTTSEVLLYGTLFVTYFLSTAIATFFTAALTHCVAAQFHGEPATFRAGLGAAWHARRRILVWAVAAATVGVIVDLLQDKFDAVGVVVASIFNASWALLTLFIVPVLVLDDVSARGMFRESAETFRRTWGESVTVSLGVGTFVFLATLVPLVVLAALFVAGVPPLVVVALAVVVVALAALVGQALGAIARTALFLYARDGDRVGPFADLDTDDLTVRTTG